MTAVAPGLATITATTSGISGSATITVTAPAANTIVASVTVSPASATVQTGATVSLGAVALNAAGQTLAGKSFVWTTALPAVATVSASGVVTGVAAGTTTITASTAGKSAIATVTVAALPTSTGAVAQDQLHEDLTLVNVSAWNQGGLAFCGQNDNGGVYFLIPGARMGENTPVVTTASRTKFLRQYFRYVRLGAVRVGATTADARFAPVAFRNTNGKYVVVVKTSAGGSFTVGGAAGRDVRDRLHDGSRLHAAAS